MDSAESPGSPKGLTEVTDDRKMRGEISDPGNLQRPTGLKINVEKSRSENNNGGSDGAVTELQRKEVRLKMRIKMERGGQ